MLQANRLYEIARDTIDARVTLPAKIAKRIAGECQHCKLPALDGSDYCAAHDAHEKGQSAKRQRSSRLRRAGDGVCVAGCGRKVKRRRRADGSLLLVRCTPCKKAHRAKAKAKRAARGVTPIMRGVTSAPDDERVTRDLEGDGYARTRYHGQSRRGQQPGWQLDEQDLSEAVTLLQRTIKGLELARDAEEAGVPRIQRQEIKDAALALAELAVGLVEEVWKRNRYEPNR